MSSEPLGLLRVLREEGAQRQRVHLEGGGDVERLLADLLGPCFVNAPMPQSPPSTSARCWNAAQAAA
eukprot:8215634-Alexandrium_andersonii.AAC.1